MHAFSNPAASAACSAYKAATFSRFGIIALALGNRIIDVSDEGAAVHMAHAHVELTGKLAVAIVTAGRGVTNTMTAIANASIARMPVLLIGGCRPGRRWQIHPMQIFDAIAQVAAPDYIGIADGGDLLSFARVGLSSRTYMDAGAFGCLGVGVPYAVAAALAFPGRQVIAANGDGAFGINATGIDTAVRHDAKAVFTISNNAA